MTDPLRLHELIQADLDGQLHGADKAELARLLLADPEARRLHDELRSTETLLRGIRQVDPPDGLRSSIQAALGLQDHNRGGRRVVDGGVGFRLAAAVVAGLVVVGLGYGLLSERRDTAALQGSIVQPASAPAVTEDVTLQLGGGTVTARMLREGSSHTLLTVQSSGLDEVTVVGRYDSDALKPAPGSLAAEQPGHFTVVLQGANRSESLEFAGTGSIRLEVVTGSEPPSTAVLGPDARD